MEEIKENKIKQEKPKVLIGMSGGVDSSASAILLKKMGYDVIGATMKLLDTNDFTADIDAKKICEQIGIPHYTIDCTENFQKHVINNFIHCYQCGKTPNPCIECNKYLKFRSFYQKALELGCQYISTGHYARVEYSEKYQQYVMKKSDADKKDQTYFLYGISKEILPKMIFPLENFRDKKEVRKVAENDQLAVASKKDSEEICFIPDNNYVAFLRNHFNKKEQKSIKEGDIVLKDGTILGKHHGLINYTVGQRKGLGIAYQEPLYVLELNQGANTLIVGTEEELYLDCLYANELNFLLDIDLEKTIEVKAKIRYRAKEADAILTIQKNGIAKVEFKEKQRAITPGQSVVFYIDNDIVLGGGKII